MKDVDLPLVLAVLGDRSFQNLILGILQREMLATRIIWTGDERVTFQTPEWLV